MMINLTKAGEKAPVMKLNLSKGDKFQLNLRWNSPQDLDAHCFILGDDERLTDMSQILSCYLLKRIVDGVEEGIVTPNSDGSFDSMDRAINHSGDSRTGTDKDIDETITIDSGKLPPHVKSIPLFVTIHDRKSSNMMTFASVKDVSVEIVKSSGEILGTLNLNSSEFNSFNGVQLGRLYLNGTNWEYQAAGSGFKGDFNTIISSFG